MPDGDWLSLLPALIAIVLAFLTRQVLVALFAGVLAGSFVLLLRGGSLAEANPITTFLIPLIGTESFAKILLIYLWCLGALIGMWNHTGAARHFAERIGHRVVRGPKTSLLFAWLVGVVFHQGGVTSAVLAGTTVRPVTDRNRVSHEELSFVVDATASPAATVLPFNAWPLVVGGAVLASGAVPTVTTQTEAIALYLHALPFNAYGIGILLAALLLASGGLPWTGRALAAARTRARTTGALDGAGAQPMVAASTTPDGSYRPTVADFLAPLATLVVVAIGGWALGQFAGIGDGDWISEAFGLAVLVSTGLALVRGMPLGRVLDAVIDGCRAMTVGAILIALAVTLGTVSRELHAADFIAGTLGGAIPAVLLPATLMATAMIVSFATGTAWGTYAVVVPIGLALAWATQPDPHFVAVCLGAVVGGGVFGDQCSPVSDTTILSAMFSGCDLMDHVKTQLPLSLAVAVLAAAVSTLAAWL